MNAELTLAEAERLTDLESVIERGLETFMEIGRALLEIRDTKLYRRDYKTFEDYCRGRWQMSARQCYRLIDSVQVVTNIQNVTPGSHSESEKTAFELPNNEKVVRSLVDLSPEQQQAVWTEACKEANGHPTAEQVKAIAAELVPPKTRSRRKRKSAEEKMADRLGMRIAFDGSMVPKDCTDDDRRQAINELNELRAERDRIRREKFGPLLHPVTEPPAPKPIKQSPAKAKERTVEQRFRDFGKGELMRVLRQYFRRSEYARVCELLTQAITKTSKIET